MNFRKALTVITLIACLFTDPSITPKYLGINPEMYVAFVFLLIFFQILFLLSRRRFIISQKIFVVFIILAIFGLISISYRILAGQSIGNLSLHMVLIANSFIMVLIFTDKEWKSVVIPAIFISGIAHFATLIPDSLGFRANLIASTAYDLGDGGLSALLRRETGLFPAPAMLVAFSVVFFIVSFLQFTSTRWKVISFSGMILSVVLGLATLNRSFIVIIVFSILILIWITGVRSKVLLLFLLGIMSLFFLPLGEHLDFVGTRFISLLEGGLDETQRWTGDTGVITGINIFLQHPLFGNPVTPNGGTLQSLGDQGQFVNPHNGYVYILSVYGLLAGAPLIYLYVISYVRASCTLFRRQRPIDGLRDIDGDRNFERLVAIFSLCLIPLLMVEPLPEYGFVMLISISPFFYSLRPFDINGVRQIKELKIISKY
jgi:hypothetical protein